MIWGDEDEENENEKENEKKEEESVEEEEKDESKKNEDEESVGDSRRILSPKEKIIELIKDKYHSIKEGIKNCTFKTVLENFDELVKNNDKVNSNFKKEEIPLYYYECFALIDEITKKSKEEQKVLTKDNKENINSLNSLKKLNVRILKKLGPSFE